MADTNTPTREDLEAMDESELQALATARGVTVTASDGSGTPSVDDYVDALAPPDAPFGGEPATDERIKEGDDKARSAQSSAAKPAKRLDETVPGGSYVNARGKKVNAQGQELGDDGKVVEAQDQKFPDSPE